MRIVQNWPRNPMSCFSALGERYNLAPHGETHDHDGATHARWRRRTVHAVLGSRSRRGAKDCSRALIHRGTRCPSTIYAPRRTKTVHGSLGPHRCAPRLRQCSRLVLYGHLETSAAAADDVYRTARADDPWVQLGAGAHPSTESLALRPRGEGSGMKCAFRAGNNALDAPATERCPPSREHTCCVRVSPDGAPKSDTALWTFLLSPGEVQKTTQTADSWAILGAHVRRSSRVPSLRLSGDASSRACARTGKYELL
ncbi:hypothetical protein C8Q77DRAFT_365261 [Trametes polyzona]|nr:hypothetical protein C8Q77DRAFT_365261 [Trametes polyzona]